MNYHNLVCPYRFELLDDNETIKKEEDILTYRIDKLVKKLHFNEFYKYLVMVEDSRKYLQEIMAKVSGLYCILITDRDGVPLLKVSSDKTPEQATRPNFISTFGLAIDQGSKLGLGKTNTLICCYSQYQVVQMNKLPLIVSFVASDSCNTGHILALEEQLDPMILQLALAVGET